MTQTAPPTAPNSPILDILILGTGWTTATYILPYLHTHHLTHASTTRTGRSSTIPFTFDPTSPSLEPYRRLPCAKTVLITFPVKGAGASGALVGGYERTRGEKKGEGDGEGEGEGGREGEEQGRGDDKQGTKTPKTHWIQLGSTGIYTAPHWNSSTSPHDTTNPRAIAEDELLSLLGTRACVLNLAGLYGGDRQPRNWVARVATSKAEVAGKAGLHLVHGRDVARAVGGVVGGWEGVRGRRWIVCDLRVYDWWDLIMSWGEGDGEGLEGREYRRWVTELMREGDVRALPREKEALGRILDGRSFWEAIGTWPGEGRVS
ncbi:hypothetical protein BDR22DRAFT_195877 [Usnea florida]